MAVLTYAHIKMTSEGVPCIEGTTTKVVEIVQDHLAHHWDAEDIQRQYPYLGLAQIHSALAYYYDHQEEIDEDIDRRRRRVYEIKSRRQDSSVREKLKNLGHLP